MIKSGESKRVLKADECGYHSNDNACCIYFDDKLGPRKAFPYTQMLGAEIDQDATRMTISYSSATVLIEGDELDVIFTLLCSRKLIGVSVVMTTFGAILDKVSISSITYSMNPNESSN